MNYLQLIDLSKAYADRYDAELLSHMDSFIILTESRINRLLKTRKQSTRSYTMGVEGKEFYPLPPDWAGMRDIQVNDGPHYSQHSSSSMKLVDPKQFEIQKNNCGSGFFYTIIANQLQVYPTLGASMNIEMIYFQKVPNLNSFATDNWLSEDHPDIYVAGMTGEISLFAKDYSAATGWFDRLKIAVDELENVDWQERWSGDPLQMRVG